MFKNLFHSKNEFLSFKKPSEEHTNYVYFGFVISGGFFSFGYFKKLVVEANDEISAEEV